MVLVNGISQVFHDIEKSYLDASDILLQNLNQEMVINEIIPRLPQVLAGELHVL